MEIADKHPLHAPLLIDIGSSYEIEEYVSRN